jgi:hypothetical protein
MHTLFAYLDPGSSSILIQLLGGGVAAAGVAIKLFWRRILVLLHLRRDEEPEDGPPAP